MDEHDLTDPHGEAEALRKENARLRAERDYDRSQSAHKSTVIDRLNARAEAAEATLAASRAPDPVANAGSCQPVENDTIDSLCQTLRRIVTEAEDERDRYGHIAATIHVNALRHGATTAEAEAMVRGEINFISWMADVIEKRNNTLPAAPVAEAQPDWKAMAERLGEALRKQRELTPKAMRAIMWQGRDGLFLADDLHKADDAARSALSDLAKMNGE